MSNTEDIAVNNLINPTSQNLEEDVSAPKTRLRTNKSKLPTFKKNDKKSEQSSTKQIEIVEEDKIIEEETETGDPKGKEKDVNLGSDDQLSVDKADSSASSDFTNDVLLLKNEVLLPVSFDHPNIKLIDS
ncbi:uncharacterized protein MELLADRAFT_59617 [Melampsora larici-populina 98AG31]|uniref:Uncharacterized protein n=1 Tax=Melampsora larici-populina (strain 98AG31 / pathotype 3-4-7) TaxID=747676 RepID=F4R863_MELLP|nr:uncharacterized protein MELLADRAFT_59617 [Melampsora larici-populina 98AG31]EGG11437.1 hypothetical protein MELLADRAFT_59617 [Melampsora larici-populina 98AG31]